MSQTTRSPAPKATSRRMAGRLVRAFCVLAAAATLGGCIVVPAGGGYYRHYPRYYYGY